MDGLIAVIAAFAGTLSPLERHRLRTRSEAHGIAAVWKELEPVLPAGPAAVKAHLNRWPITAASTQSSREERDAG